MFKKSVSLMLALLMIFSMTACGAQTAPVQEAEVQAQTQADAAPIDFKALTPEEAAKVQIDIYILAGQSNASGSTSFESAKEGERDNNSYENVRMFCTSRYADGTDRNSNRNFDAVREGMGGRIDRIGPELGMARALNEKYSTNACKAVILKVGAGGTSLLYNDESIASRSDEVKAKYTQRGSWYPASLDKSTSTDPNRPGGFLTRLLKDSVAECYAELLKRGFTAENIHFKALCWMQGEEDRSYARKYYDVFPVFAEEIRTQVSTVAGSDYSTLPIVIGEISETCGAADAATVKKNQNFIHVQRKLAEAVPNTTVIPTSVYAVTELQNGTSVNVGSDNYHWSYHDILEIGALFANTAYGA